MNKAWLYGSFIGTLFTTSHSLFAQSAPEKLPAGYTYVEQMPRFHNGGTDSLFAFIVRNLHYPAEAYAKGIQGRVFVYFVVDTLGTVTQAKVVKGVEPSLDAEALRVVQIMPHWEPGRQVGKPVSVSFTLPVNFRTPAPAQASPKKKAR